MFLLATTLPVLVYSRPSGNPPGEWRELDVGPGIIHLPDGEETGARLRNIGDAELETFAGEAASLASLAMLNLSENRAISDDGLRALSKLNLRGCVKVTHAGAARLRRPGLEIIR